MGTLGGQYDWIVFYRSHILLNTFTVVPMIIISNFLKITMHSQYFFPEETRDTWKLLGSGGASYRHLASLGVRAWRPKAINILYSVALGECSY